MSSQDRAKKNNKKKRKKEKYKNKNKMCRGGGGTNLLYLLCLISNTMPQLEQSSLQPSTDLQHRHLLQTTSYNHLLRLHLLISRRRKYKQQQVRNPPPPPRRGVEKPEGPSALQPTTEYRNLSILRGRYETILSLSHTFKSWVYVFTFLCLYEPFFIGFCDRQNSFVIFPQQKYPGSL